MAETAEPAAPRPHRVSRRALALLASIAVVAYGTDQLTKALVVANLDLGEPVPVLGELLQFRYVLNPGAAFSLGEGATWIFSIVAAGVAVFIVAFARRIRSLAWATVFGLLLGGTVGNLTDRLTREPGFGRGHVIDFLQLYGFPAIFNIADVAIVSAMVLFVLLTILGVGLDGSRERSSRSKRTEDTVSTESA